MIGPPEGTARKPPLHFYVVILYSTVRHQYRYGKKERLYPAVDDDEFKLFANTFTNTLLQENLDIHKRIDEVLLLHL